MRCYAVVEMELDYLSRSSNRMTVALAVAGAALGYGVDWLMEWRMNGSTEALVWTTACAFVAVVFSIWGGMSWWSRRTVLNQIKDQAEDLAPA